jgi:hypothetical protein
MCRLLPLVILLMTSPAYAQDPPIPQDAVSNPAGPCFLSMRGGSGANAFQSCLSPTGNLTRWNVGGIEHLDIFDAIEGWRVCQAYGPIDPITGIETHWEFAQDLDAGREDHQPGPSTYAQPNGPGTWPFTVTTDLNPPDRLLRLTQYFSRNTAHKTVTIKMRVHNLTTATTGRVWLQRWIDVDAEGTPSNDVATSGANYAMMTGSPGLGTGVMLTADTAGILHEGGQAPWVAAPEYPQHACVGDPHAAEGDSMMAVTYYLGKIKAGSSKTVSFTYRAF